MTGDPTPIRRCVCGDRTFAELREEGYASLEEIQQRTGAGTHCHTCVPYLVRMLETGQTAFAIGEPDLVSR
ncbi:MAG: (2Fe-2S)-binding protein [Fimbriimonadaceae bacterium]|nr:(2Fe-2S)-binding protein [Fimbriimonadaceae bacterium]